MRGRAGALRAVDAYWAELPAHARNRARLAVHTGFLAALIRASVHVLVILVRSTASTVLGHLCTSCFRDESQRHDKHEASVKASAQPP